MTRPEFKEDKPLGRFLRSKELSAELHDYPYVESLRIREREYLATKDKTEIGYDIEIVLYQKAGDGSKGCRSNLLRSGTRASKSRNTEAAYGGGNRPGAFTAGDLHTPLVLTQRCKAAVSRGQAYALYFA